MLAVFIFIWMPGSRQSGLNRILDTLQADIMIADSPSLKEAGPISFAGEIPDMGMLLSLGSDAQDPLLLASIRGQAMDTDPLYGIFTSGSTGAPKGVVVGHRSVIDFMEHFTEMFHITSRDVIGNQAPFDFDVSVKGYLFNPENRASMEIIPKRLFSIPQDYWTISATGKITTAIWAVSALCIIITTLNGFTYRVPEHLDKNPVQRRGHACETSERLAQPIPSGRHVRKPKRPQWKSPVTAPTNVVDRDFEPGSPIPIGLPIAKVFLLDEDDRPYYRTGTCGSCACQDFNPSGPLIQGQGENRGFICPESPEPGFILETI